MVKHHINFITARRYLLRFGGSVVTRAAINTERRMYLRNIHRKHIARIH